ncbi:hypothetical protein A1O3_09774 [Capronia epimyces CBS 606.96]|uniref:Uncharacterized protein n=1 Tax=Capronia epimyces CBS 606.96 TaxID=1182542 RepID=W9XAP8_9EURO|nr:uncharacterized protein A1O3_09774 [Capronia epimyces CBS 606.96]EXJ77547.1 hypothetical protein A1O3_09774 [Capronia epimyces CBS 606.96]
MSAEKPQAPPGGAADNGKGSADPTAVAPLQSQPHHVLHFGDIQQYHAGMNQPPPPYNASSRSTQQVTTPWMPQTSLSHGQWTYNLPADRNVDDGRMRIFEGQITTTIRGVETTMNYEKFLALDKDSRNALLTAGAPPPPPPVHVPPPPPPPLPASSTVAPQSNASESATPPPEEPKCMSCHLPAQLFPMHGITVCARCAALDNMLSMEHRCERKPTA